MYLECSSKICGQSLIVIIATITMCYCGALVNYFCEFWDWKIISASIYSQGSSLNFKSVVFVICWVLGLTKWGCLSNHSVERVWSTQFAIYIFQIHRSYLWCLIKIIMCTSVEGNNGSGKLGMENANESIIETEIENDVMMSTNWLYTCNINFVGRINDKFL